MCSGNDQWEISRNFRVRVLPPTCQPVDPNLSKVQPFNLRNSPTIRTCNEKCPVSAREALRSHATELDSRRRLVNLSGESQTRANSVSEKTLQSISRFVASETRSLQSLQQRRKSTQIIVFRAQTNRVALNVVSGGKN